LSQASQAPPTHAAVAANALYIKIAWRILPILFVSYIVAYLDRVNIGFAKLQMMGDLKFSDTVYGFGAGIFFLGYFLFEVPSNVILHRVGARVWICRMLVTWGIISGCTALVRSPWQFYTARCLLGVAESGFFPGMILYLTYWFPSHRRGKMTAILLAGNAVSGIVGFPISGYILHHFARGPGLSGWQWLFILEAIPAVILGVVVFFFLDDRVANVTWLTSEQKAFLAAEVGEEAAVKTHKTVLSVFTSSRVWVLGAIYFGIQMGSYATGFWIPTILSQTGVKDALNVGLLSAFPYVLALIAMTYAGRSSDRTRERRWHVVVPCILAALGFALCTQAGSSTSVAVAGLSLAVVGVVTSLPMFWALPTSFLGGTAAAASIALINCTGNLGGFFSPAIIGLLKTRTGTLNSGLFLIAGCMTAAALLILTLIPAKLVNR
jgi:D-galactonate transporter